MGSCLAWMQYHTESVIERQTTQDVPHKPEGNESDKSNDSDEYTSSAAIDEPDWMSVAVEKV